MKVDKNISVSIGNNLNAILKGGVNSYARVKLHPKNIQEITTPEIDGGQTFTLPKGLEVDQNTPELNIHVLTNKLGEANLKIDVPVNKNNLYINLEGTYNGHIDIQYQFS